MMPRIQVTVELTASSIADAVAKVSAAFDDTPLLVEVVKAVKVDD